MIEIPEIIENAVPRILGAYGDEPQIRQTMEECGELIVALNKHLRTYNDVRNGKIKGSVAVKQLAETRSSVCEEIADVIIMCYQMAYLHDPGAIEITLHIQRKLERQLKRLEGGGK